MASVQFSRSPASSARAPAALILLWPRFSLVSGSASRPAPAAVADALAEAGSDAVKDLAEQCTLLSLVGPDAAELLVRSGAPGVMEQEVGTHATFGFEGCPVVAAFGGDLLAADGTFLAAVNLVADEGIAGLLWNALKGQGAEPVGSQALDAVLAE